MPDPAPLAPKQILRLQTAASSHWVGNGFPVRSVFSYDDLGREILSPFLLMDYAGPAHFQPAEQPRGVGEHPHRGFETVTLVYAGEVDHRDSGGGGGTIGPGDVQWMTAAAGVMHEEKHSRAFTRSGGRFELVQLWVNLPAAAKMDPPRYQTLTRAAIPSVALPGGGTVRVVAGEYAGARGPARTVTPMNVWDLAFPAGSGADFILPEGHTTAVFTLDGQVDFGDTREAGEATLAVFSREGRRVALTARGPTRLLLLSGEPIPEPVVGYGPFVMNRLEEIHQAFADVAGGRFGTVAPAARA